VQLGVKRWPHSLAIVDIVVVVIIARGIQIVAIICIIVVRRPGPGINKPPQTQSSAPQMAKPPFAIIISQFSPICQSLSQFPLPLNFPHLYGLSKHFDIISQIILRGFLKKDKIFLSLSVFMRSKGKNLILSVILHLVCRICERIEPRTDVSCF